MKYIVTLFWFACALEGVAETKCAVVRVTDIYRGLLSTRTTQEGIEKKRSAISENERAQNFFARMRENEGLRAQLQAQGDDAEPEEMRNFASAYGLKAQEAEALRVAFEEFKIAENTRLNRHLVEGMRTSLERITSVVTQIAKKRYFDSVLDISGNSNTGIPVVLYVADDPYIAEDVLENFDENEAVEATSDGESPKSTEGESPEE